MLALGFRIQGVVHCYPKTTNTDGSLNGVCYVDRGRFGKGDDLSAYLPERG